MTIVLATKAIEESTYAPQISFFDEADPPNAITPTSITWTLMSRPRKVVNGRSAVSVTPAPVITIVLSGDDLALSHDARRYLLIEAVYSSDLGSNLPFREEIQFSIAPLVGV